MFGSGSSGRVHPYVVEPTDVGGKDTDWNVFDANAGEVSYTFTDKGTAVEEAEGLMNHTGGPGVVVLDGIGDFQRFISNEYYWKQYELGVR